MKTKFGFIDPGAIMGVVVSLIILAVGVFAFFVTVNSLPGGNSLDAFGTSYYPANGTFQYSNFTQALYDRLTLYNASQSTLGTGNSVFNIIGIVIIIGAIMAIVGLVYNYVR